MKRKQTVAERKEKNRRSEPGHGGLGGRDHLLITCLKDIHVFEWIISLLEISASFLLRILVSASSINLFHVQKSH